LQPIPPKIVGGNISPSIARLAMIVPGSQSNSSAAPRVAASCRREPR
jgi:hypothetical protein